jgi:hypothetical protein
VKLREKVARALYAQRPFAIASTATTHGHQVAQTFDWDGAPAYYQEDLLQLADAVLAVPEIADAVRLTPIQTMPTRIPRGDKPAEKGVQPKMGTSENG